MFVSEENYVRIFNVHILRMIDLITFKVRPEHLKEMSIVSIKMFEMTFRRHY